ncbi:MAG: adenylate/guanylate cyclase domain-containing protein [Nitrospirae bacterium]|nr:adenylate/guanylate cyclase domain-containing protein [Magnetococcales bacterium]HAT51259.1 hypothetical protein [Alphaproteobacteria bacterium]
MTHWQAGRYLSLIGITILFLIQGFGIFRLPVLDRFESVVYDFKVLRTAPDSKDPRIIIVDIDEKSLARLGPWPWPRDRLASLVDTLFDHYRIGVLGLDLVFPNADSGSGLASLESLAKGPLSQDSAFLNQFLKLRPSLDTDRIFSQSLRDRPVILGFNFRQTAVPGAANVGKLPQAVITLRELGYDDINSVNAFGYMSNIAEVQDATSSAGFLDTPTIDPDGVVRRTPLLQVYAGSLYQSLSLGIIRAILGDPPLTLGVRSRERDKGNETDLEWVSLGPHKIRVDAKGSIFVPYRGAKGSFPYYSVIDILERTPEKKDLDAAIVLIGSSVGAGMRPLLATPVQSGLPSVEFHANIISGMLDGTFKNLPESSPWPECLLIAVIGAMVIFVFPWIAWPWRLLAASLLVFVMLMINIYVWKRWDLYFPLAPSLTLLLLLCLVDWVVEVFGISRKRNRMVAILGKKTPIELIDKTIRSGGSFATKGGQTEVTVIMCTIRDFSRISKELDATELVAWVRCFLKPLTEIVYQYLGNFEYCDGELFVAYWGGPVEDPKHGSNAMSALMAMKARLEMLEDELQMRGWPLIRCDFAIQSGTVTYGVIESDFRNDLMIFGEPTHQVKRLVNLTGCYSVPILAGEKTKTLVPQMVFRELDRILSEGSDEAFSIYAPVGFRNQVTPEMRSRLESFHKAIAQFRNREWDLAEQGLKNLLQKDPEDRLYEIYLARIAEFRKNPPPSHWNGSCQPPKFQRVSL